MFLDSTATGALGPSGSFESWASGVLYERVRIEGSGIRLTLDGSRSQGGGWTAANSVVWNCEAKDIEARGPEGAENLVNRSTEPLYETQLAKRTGGKLGRQPLSDGVPSGPGSESTPKPPLPRPPHPRPVQIVNGRFVADGKVLWGGTVNAGWWRGQAVPAAALDAGVSLTRFVPGRTGPGLTEDLPALAALHGGAGHTVFPGDSRAVVRPPARRTLHRFAGRRECVGAVLRDALGPQRNGNRGGRAQPVRPDALQPLVFRAHTRVCAALG